MELLLLDHWVMQSSMPRTSPSLPARTHRQHLGAQQRLGIFEAHAASARARQLGPPLLQVQDVLHRGRGGASLCGLGKQESSRGCRRGLRAAVVLTRPGGGSWRQAAGRVGPAARTWNSATASSAARVSRAACGSAMAPARAVWPQPPACRGARRCLRAAAARVQPVCKRLEICASAVAQGGGV